VIRGLQRLITTGQLTPDHFFYKFLAGVVAYAKAKHGFQMKWHEDIISFVETVQFFGGARAIEILRGTGFRQKGHLALDFDRFNLPLPTARTLRHRNAGSTFESGVEAAMLKAFLKVANHNDRIQPLISVRSVKIFPVLLQRDGLALAPGLQAHPANNSYVGGKEPVDVAFMAEHKNPSADFVKSFLFAEANQLLLGTLDGQLALPVGTDGGPKAKTKENVADLLTKRIVQLQVCLRCLVRDVVKTQHGVIVDSGETCTSDCKGEPQRHSQFML
jgi:hypothetical protein